MSITHEERVKLLKCFNDLKNILQTIYDCHDLFMSDIGKLELIQYELSTIGKFERGEDYYGDHVLTKETDDA